MTAMQHPNAAETLIFSCSGAADVGEIADRAARAMMKQGCGKMFCLAGIGGHVPDILERARAAGALLVIDGCEKDCGRHCLDRAGLHHYSHVRLTDQQMEKGKTPVTHDAIARAAQLATQVLATARC